MDKKNFCHQGTTYVLHLAARPYIEYYQQYKKSTIKRRKRIFKPFAHCITIKQMERAALRWLDEPATVKHDLITAYLHSAKDKLKPKTLITYTGMLRRLQKWCAHHKLRIDKLKAEHAHLYMDYLFAQKLHPNTIAHNINVVRIAFNDMARRGQIKHNAFAGVKTPKKAPQPLKYFTDNQIELIKQWCQAHDPQLWLAILLQFSCFIRPNELRHLRVHDINIKDSTIELRAELSKNKKYQRVVIPHHLKGILLQHISGYSPSAYLFTISGVPGAQIIGRDYLSKHHKICMDLLGIKGNYGFYSWKHTGVVKAVQAGINIRDIQNQLRHHSLDMVQKYLASLGAVDSDELRNNMPRI